ncbi:MAG: TetR/AcrR family transcriptional regulator [Pseudomonadota bacterium]
MSEPNPKLATSRVGRPSRSPEAELTLQATIVDAARALFVQEGVDSVSMRKIAARANISPMTIYTVFTNKRALLYHIWDDIFAALDARIRKVRDGQPDAASELLAILHCMLTYWLENPDCYRVIYLHQDVPAEGSEEYYVDGRQMARLGALQEVLEAGIANQQLKAHNTQIQAEVLYTQILGLALAYITIPEYPWQQAEDMLEAITDAVLRRLNPTEINTE